MRLNIRQENDLLDYREGDKGQTHLSISSKQRAECDHLLPSALFWDKETLCSNRFPETFPRCSCSCCTVSRPAMKVLFIGISLLVGRWGSESSLKWLRPCWDSSVHGNLGESAVALCVCNNTAFILPSAHSASMRASVSGAYFSFARLAFCWMVRGLWYSIVNLHKNDTLVSGTTPRKILWEWKVPWKVGEFTFSQYGWMLFLYIRACTFREKKKKGWRIKKEPAER